MNISGASHENKNTSIQINGHSQNGQSSRKESTSKLLPLLGWFSLGLGLAELIRPGRIAKAAGLPEESRNTVRAFGAREIVSGLGMFSRRAQPAASWSRVAGDVLDLSVLGKSFFNSVTDKRKLGISTVAVLGVTALDILASVRETSALKSYGSDNPLTLDEAIGVNKSPAELFRYWRNLSNLPNFMSFLDRVVEIDQKRSHWKTKEIAGKYIDWKAVIKNEKESEFIEWETEEESTISHSGSVTFESLPEGHGTKVRLKMSFAPKIGSVVPAGLGGIFSYLGKEKILNDLKRFRQLIETGEIATTSGQPAGRSDGETTLDKIAGVKS